MIKLLWGSSFFALGFSMGGRYALLEGVFMGIAGFAFGSLIDQ
jgi:hypothetical protein